ncbi:MAG: peptidylprolyl isomerase [Oscillospiraceae bacterium]|nr:peptidylprolyl isomerase [Oscillospiraceae bacterium]
MKGKLRCGIFVLCAIAALGLGLYAVKQTEFPTVEFIIPYDGAGEGVASIGEYSGEANPDQIVAEIGDMALTNAQLQVYYCAQIASHQRKDMMQPDLRLPLSWQKCPLDENVDSWEQYFLNQALDTWHAAQALTLQGDDQGLLLDERYAPSEKLHEQYLTDKPATAYLYGYSDGYQLNTLHREYIEQLPDLFDTLAEELDYYDGEELARMEFGTTEEALCQAAGLFNQGYSYYTALGYLIESDESQMNVEPGQHEEPCVSFRQVLLIPEKPFNAAETGVPYQIAEDGTVSCAESGWTKCEKKARTLLKSWEEYFLCTEGTFGQLAYTESEDAASQPNGGYYGDVVRGQVPASLEEWLFDPQREVGDTTVIRSDYGVHILYFSNGTTVEQKARIDEATMEKLLELIETAKAQYPMEVDYAAISLQPGNASVSYDDFLYGDIAHERYPEMPLYLQNDYGSFTYGGYPLTTHGCGICSLAMVATYVTDTEWTPTELSDMFGDYCSFMGTDVCLFWQALSEVDYYFKGYVYKDDEAWQALEDGFCIIVRERGGYWTNGCGHYITLEKLTENGQVVVRDSSLLNFGKLEGHAVDAFDWDKITGQAAVYLVFGKKVTQNDACVRCGDPSIKTVQLIGDSYTCPKCDTALLRRNTYLLGTA